MPSPHPLRALSRPEPPPDLHDRIAAAIRAEAARQRRRRRLRRCAVVGVVALSLSVAMPHGGMR